MKERFSNAILPILLILLVVGPEQAGYEAAGQSQPTRRTSRWTLSDAIAKGPLLLTDENFQLFAVRRDRPGTVEQHALDADVLFILEGAATLVTGGTVEGSREVRANEFNGTEIRGGDAVSLERGDVIAVPSGTPHWFQNVKPSISYYALKVRDEKQTGSKASVVHVKRSQAFDGRSALSGGIPVRIGALRLNRSPLPVELHENGTDIVFVINGTGVFVTDGAIVDARTIRPGEQSGSSIVDGVQQPLGPGTGMVIPRGTPHWLQSIDGTLEFFAVRMP